MTATGMRSKRRGGDWTDGHQYLFIEKIGRSEGAHADGNQTTDGSNITFRYNNIYMPESGSPARPVLRTSRTPRSCSGSPSPTWSSRTIG